MNTPNIPPSAPDDTSSDSTFQPPSRHPTLKAIIILVVAGLLGVGGYSIYMAGYDSDPQETVILGQAKMAAGSPAALRVLVRDRLTGKPVSGAQVELSLQAKAKATTKLGSFRTDATGSIADAINIPDIAAGDYELVIDTRSSLGRDHVVKRIEVEHPARILLSNDKPIYQPGQTIHLRCLALNDRTQKPFTNLPVVFEVSDPQGNKVFSETHQPSAFGIAAADFVLATELNLGRYEIRALTGAATAEHTVEVKRYVLPKFKISLTTDKPAYLPGQTVSGAIKADYLFGKPVANGAVKLSVATFQDKPVAVTELNGKTDADGTYHFQFAVPDVFAGLPQNNRQAFLDLTAEIHDTGQHAEQKVLSLSVAQSELNITAIPEAGVFVPGVENMLYVLTTYPDGSPAGCQVFMDGKSYAGDAQGICKIQFSPTAADQTVELQAIDTAGRKQKLTFKPEVTADVPALLLRADKAIYHPGDTANLSILSPAAENTVFIDVIQDGQTVLTKSVPLANHKAEYGIKLPPTLTGVMKLHAYVITDKGEDAGCTRMVYVNPAAGLQINTLVSKPVYRPGEVARLDFTVTDSAGQPVPAALSTAIVDESVFALAENRPGLLQPFPDLESGLLKPHYQIRLFDSPGRLLESGDQNLAGAFFASLEERPPGRTLAQLVKDGYVPQSMVDYVQEMRGTPYYEQMRQDPEYAELFKLLEGEGSIYNLRATTGPMKLKQAEMQRKAYFNHLEQFASVGFVGLLILAPIFLFFHSSRPSAGIKTGILLEKEAVEYVRHANGLYNSIGLLTLLPMLGYPLGLYIFDRYDAFGRYYGDEQVWILFGLESAIVLLTVFMQYLRLASMGTGRLVSELAPLRIFITAFLIQFVVSRSGIILIASYHGPDEAFTILWFLGSIIAPLIVLGSLGSYVRRQLSAKGIEFPAGGSRLLEVLAVIAIIVVLAAMLLPSLAAAKKKAQKVSLANELKQIDLASKMADEDGAKPAGGAVAAAPHIRRDFPETLFWRPELITDDHGRASLEIPLADSITTWRASVDGVSAAGKMGGHEFPITVFQDFFADIDLPVSMSLGDQVSVPVTCYNYLKVPQDVRLDLAKANWFESTTQTLTVHLGPEEVKSVYFPVKVLQVGEHVLRVTAQGTKTADAVEREIRVVPTGERVEQTRNDVLKEDFADTFTVPAESIPQSQSLWVKLYPSRFSEIVEGLDSIFQEPYGCFEQTSSTTYPNVLAFDYLKRMGRLTPATEARARKLINTGYQRLLTFEVPGGGFEWFGHDPAHVGLTAYGIMEFSDMTHVQPVDAAMIERTKQWLYSKQNADGSWDPARGMDEWSGNSPVTAYVAWALAETGEWPSALDRALDYLRSHPEKLFNNYQKALAANAFLARNRTDAFGRKLLEELKSAAITDGKLTHWPSEGLSLTYSHGSEIEVETTALCAMAMIKTGLWPETVKQSLGWISKRKTGDGTWGTTQATILAMRALIQGSTAALGQDFASTVTVSLNGEPVEVIHLNHQNSDVLKQIDLTKSLRTGVNSVTLHQSPGGELPIQLSGVYWLPSQPAAPAKAVHPAGSLHIDVRYDRTTLAVNEPLKCTVALQNNTGENINMALVDLGIPPGFTVDTDAFESLQQEGKIEKFEATENQVVLYLRQLPAGAPVKFDYSLRAKYPLRVQAPASAVYEYYQPKNRAESVPLMLQAGNGGK
ncbi:MAG TPA: MG2 domain-containing protein [Candidatus Acidoferrales bacterium]|nr:MG2 domain-containing protein [Candidatus Acidoferrales bacterium]